jgi:hypothetical protein
LDKIFTKAKKIVSDIFDDDKIYDTEDLARNSTEFINPIQNEFILTTKKTTRLFVLIISHVFAAFLIFGDTKIFIQAFSHFSFDTLFFGFFTIVVIPIVWYNYFDNKPKLTISNEGIKIDNKDFYYWDMILTTSIKETKHDKGKFFLLLLVQYGNAEAEEIKIDITYLNKKPQEIAQIIEAFKRRSTATNKSITENAG